MDKQKLKARAASFLEEAAEQIAYKPLRPAIREELENHLEDLAESYENDGMSEQEAAARAILDMGDPTVVGTELNAVHQLRKTPALFLFSWCFLAAGLILTIWIPERYAYPSGFLYYIFGAVVLTAAALKGYPLFVRYWKQLAAAVLFLYAAGGAFRIVLDRVSGESYGWRLWALNNPSIQYFGVLLLAPILALLFYRNRRSLFRTLRAAVVLAAVWGVFAVLFLPAYRWSAALIALFSSFGVFCFMIRRGMFSWKKRNLYAAAISCFLLFGSPALLFHSGYLLDFAAPESRVTSLWDDAYNSVLIKELLGRTPAAEGLSLSQDDLIHYKNGSWLPMHPKEAASGRSYRYSAELAAQENRPYFASSESEKLSLWDVLPQHFQNNYRIAFVILRWGWAAGLALIGLLLLFYWKLFSCILAIRGTLASCLAFACGQCLLWQTVFYLLGNFGFQYSAFPSLPLISEGWVSILVNAALLGMIISACRCDQVALEPSNFTAVSA